ncbi:blast:Odorant receptor 33b [Drosophila guanche]|uniref:Blast:Odorant receptor 33b n=1 Tax=Drosophila guanche TaxID=7266 RepID=A0A3B0JBY3_DROGU|nr:blast:Odorant receptor 33b [Drosophila guanche]
MCTRVYPSRLPVSLPASNLFAFAVSCRKSRTSRHCSWSWIGEQERAYFDRNTQREANFVWKSFIVAYGLSNVAAIASVLFGKGHKLLYPAWFQIYWLSVAYQIAGVGIQIVQNLANDSYPPMTFCVVAGHVRLLSMRLSRMGYEGKAAKATVVKELLENIEDHRKIVELLRSTMHLSQLFFAENNFAMTYYGVYFVAMLLELFPCCYYGTLISVELNRLTDSIFSSNWVGMERGYCRSLLIFMQLTLANVEIRAGGMIGISLNAFFVTIRLAYSFFTLAMSLRK